MKITAAAAAALVVLLFGYASAGGKPELSLTIKDGLASGSGLVSAVAPKLSYAGDYGDGFHVQASIDSDLSKSLSVEKNLEVLENWNLRTHAEYTEGKYDYGDEGNRGVYLTAEVNNDDEDTFAWCSGAVCLEKARPLKLGAKRILEVEDVGKFMVEPRYSFEKNEPDVCLGFEAENDSDTRVYLTASREDQNIKLIHKRDKITASIKAGMAQGFMMASLEQDSSDIGKVKCTVTPNDLDVELRTTDGWTAGVNVGMEGGLSLESEPKVRFSKKLTFTT